jgi:hypothetical protein
MANVSRPRLFTPPDAMRAAPVEPSTPPMSPGDEAPEGTEGTAPGICPQCGGTGTLDGKSCAFCEGTGQINVGIGGA